MNTRSLPTSYAGQIKDRGEGKSWRALGTANEPYEAGQKLADEMQRHGLRYSEIGGESGHIADMVNGEELSADDGTLFRVVDLSEEQGK